MAAARDQRAERVRFAGEAGQRVGVEHDGPPARRPGQRRRDEFAQFGADARAGPERDRAAARVGEQRLEARQAGEGGDHHRGRMRGVDGDRIDRARDRDDSRAGPERRPRGEPGRARLMRRAGEDERRAARIFVRCVGRGAAARRRQRTGELTKAFGAMRASTLAGMPMSARRIVPQSDRPGSSRWPGFSRKKVTVEVASTAAPRTLPVAPSRPEGTSTATTRPPPRPKPLIRSTIARASPVDVARQPRAEDGVDDAVGAGKIDVRRGQNLARETGGRERGVAAERLAPPEEAELDGIAPLRQETRGDETVAAVVAGAAQHDDPAARPREARRLVGDRAPGGLHQRDPRGSARDRHAVGLAHLGRGQEMREVQRIEHDGQGGTAHWRWQAIKTSLHRRQFCYIAPRG